MTSDAPQLAETTALLDAVATATAPLVPAVAALTDADLVEPSLLPGWTRGHVLAHLSRNADSLVNLLLWARTGIETPQYASQFLREADIEAGAPRPCASNWRISPPPTNAGSPWRASCRRTVGPPWSAIVRAEKSPPPGSPGCGCSRWKSTTSI